MAEKASHELPPQSAMTVARRQTTVGSTMNHELQQQLVKGHEASRQVSQNTYKESPSTANFRQTCMTGVRSAGFFSNTRRSTADSLEGTMKFRSTADASNAQKEFPSRNTVGHGKAVTVNAGNGGGAVYRELNSIQSQSVASSHKV